MLEKIVVHSMEKKRLRSLMIVADTYGGNSIVENKESHSRLLCGNSRYTWKLSQLVLQMEH
jgi:hypothetical protein